MTVPELDGLADRLVADGDVAFPELVRALTGPVFSGVYRLLGDHHDAEEVTQETFLRAHRALKRYPETQVRSLRLQAWVWTIALNLCRNQHRHRSRRPVTTRLDERHHPAAGDDTERTALDAVDPAWNRRLGRLPAPVRSAVVLRHVVGLGYDDIAAAVDRPAGTVKSDVHRGLRRLRAILVEEGANP